jgi:hypothetical protein
MGPILLEDDLLTVGRKIYRPGNEAGHLKPEGA